MEKSNIEKLFVIGGSSGSLDVLFSILPLLQPLINAAMVIVLHRKSSFDTTLTDVLSLRTRIKVKEAEEKETIQAGTIYIAPADYHLLLEKDGSLSLDTSEKINYSRPSIDVCMETAVDAFGSKTVAVLLSGANADGVYGLKKVKRIGGTTIAQNPETAEVDYMPRQAIEQNAADFVLKPDEIAAWINNGK